MQSGKVNLTIVLPANDKTTSSTVGLLLGWDCDAEAADCARGTPTGYTFESGVARLVGVQVPNPRTWQPERNPTVAPRLPLHNLTVRLARGGDAITVRFGLRVVSTRGRDILLNGEIGS